MTQTQPIRLVERVPSPTPASRSHDEYTGSSDFRDRTPIVIDNGTSELRAGFASQYRDAASSSSPARTPLHFPPIVAKYKDRKRAANILLCGSSAHMDHESKSKARTATEGGLIVAQDVFENVLDFTFSKLGISGEAGVVYHPIVMTEPLCNPGYCRGLTSELLFEAYGVPSVSYGLDSLFSAYANDVGPDAVIVNAGCNNTSIVPMLGGRGALSSAKRMNWGGSLASDYLLRLMQLKYPAFPLRLSSNQASSLIETPSLFYTQVGGSEDYSEHVRNLANLKSLQAEGRTIQVPFVVPESSRRKELTEEERQRREEKKVESGRRLQEMTQRIRLQKLREKEQQLGIIAELKDSKAKERRNEWLSRVEAAGFDSEQDMEKEEKKIRSALKRSRRRDGPEDEDDAAEEPPSFPLVEIPDHELDEESIKEKRRQRLLKAGFDARMRAKAEKLEEKRQEEESRRLDEEERTNNPTSWCTARRQEYEAVIDRIKERKRRKDLLSDRKSLAAQQRMKSITNLASDQPGAGNRSKRKRGGGDDDDFGADDEDWGVYRDIQGAEDSEDEHDDEEALLDLESKLLQYDTSFSRSDTLAARQARKRALTRTFLGGDPEFDEVAVKAAAGEDDPEDDEQDEDSMMSDLAKAHQVTINVERARIAEVFFQPNLAGVDQAGVDEIVEMVLRGFDDDARRRMVSNIFVTGRHSSYANFDTRLKNAMISCQPIDYKVNVIRAKDVRFDAWKGMAKWALEKPADLKAASVTKADYEEYGAEYTKEHPFASAMI